jgi:serine/threonine-protein kinase
VSLAPGTRLGSYDVTAQIGAGGMGEVYRARDSKLDRDVALKVLPAALAQDPERLARFEREARTLAQLNHPNIAAIYGVEDSTATKALVMELVEGPTLADRIALGPLPLDEALPILRQLAEALETAHEQGIVHRDLKPANIKVRADGTVKVLDFGLAKALEPAGAAAGAGVSQFATITTPAMTQAGVILGTAAYMSPEQARGKPVDRRTDIWAIGCVLYEMLSGQRPFEGETVSDVLSAVLRAEPDWSRVPATTPPAISTLMRRCLRKETRQRLADASSIRLEIDDAPAAATAPARSGSRPLTLRTAVLVAAVAAIAAAAASDWWRSRGATPAAVPFARVAVPLPSGTELRPGASAVVSPDGSTLAFVADRDGIADLYLRRLADAEARVVKDTRGAAAPFFSPDSETVAFFVGNTLKRLSTKTGVITTIASSLLPIGDWAPDGRIISVAAGERPRPNATATLAVIPAGGGEPRLVKLKSAPDTALVRFVSWLPGGTSVLVATADEANDTSVKVVSLESGESRTLLERGASPRYLPTGHLVFIEEGVLKAVPFSPSTLDIGGEPVDVLSGVRQQTFNLTGAFSCSSAGSCAYAAGGTTRSRTVVTIDRAGTQRALGRPPNSYTNPRFSPSGDRILWWIEQRDCEIEVFDVARESIVRLKPAIDSHFPTWTPDGREISFDARNEQQGAYALYTVAADGSGKAQPLLSMPSGLTPLASMSWSPQRVLVFNYQGDLWTMRRGDTEPKRIEETRASELTPVFSPDGRWIAYTSEDDGTFDVYVRPFPGPGERHVISAGGGTEPVWARNGRELFFRNGDRYMVVDISTIPTFTASRPRLMFTVRTPNAPGRTGYDVSPDGQTFVMTDPGEDERAAGQVMLLQNWFEELKRLAPTPAGQR